MEMIYPSYSDSFNQAVASMQQTLSKRPARKLAQQRVLVASSAESDAKPKELTIVKEKKEEDEEDSQHYLS